MTNHDIAHKIADSRHTKVKLAVSDIDGILRGKIVLKEKFMEIYENSFGFCDVVFGWDAADSCYTNSPTTGWHTAYPDARAAVDLSTYRKIPWNDDLPFFLADFEQDSQKSMASCPRSLLKRVRKQAVSMGFHPLFSQEFEWFNFKGTPQELAARRYTDLQPISPGMFGYSLLRPSLYQEYFDELFDLLEKFDIPLEGLHTETGPGVYEAAIRYDEVLAAADKATLFKNSVKEIAYRHGIVASFIAKWNQQLPGCGGHIHQSLWDKDRKKNLFFDTAAEHQMSTIMRQYLAGILHCLPHILPLYAPTINSYKRLAEGTWAPTTISWGVENRTTAVRVITGSDKAHRLEMRTPGSDTNPYLAMAASLASGLYGIEKELKLENQICTGNAYTAPDKERIANNLHTATRKMKNSELARELFGESFVDHFCSTREWECQQYNRAVTDWEINRYFEII